MTSLDAVAFTHDHADHTHGIDDIRVLTIANRRMMNGYLDARASEALHQRFGYIFRSPEGSQYPPIIIDHRIEPGRSFTVEGKGGALTLTPIRVIHGDIDALGFRIGRLAYSPDLSDVPAESLPLLEGLECWVVDALREKPHPSHFSLSEALAWINRMRPERAVLTNLHTDLDFQTLSRRLPHGVEPAFDGMTIEFSA